VICQGAVQTQRVAPAVDKAKLSIEARLDVIPREGKPVLVSIFTLARRDEARPLTESTLVVRRVDGQWTDDFRVVRHELGMPPGRHD